MRLPAGGRSGPVPAWPLESREPSCWRELWKLPQAVAWEQLHISRVVARYAFLVSLAETADKYAMAEARQLEDRLGLNPMSMLRLRWQIDAETDDKPRKTRGDVAALDDYRNAI